MCLGLVVVEQVKFQCSTSTKLELPEVLPSIKTTHKKLVAIMNAYFQCCCSYKPHSSSREEERCKIQPSYTTRSIKQRIFWKKKNRQQRKNFFSFNGILGNSFLEPVQLLRKLVRKTLRWNVEKKLFLCKPPDKEGIEVVRP
jgi:hypothetical protein